MISRRTIIIAATLFVIGFGLYFFNLTNPLFWDDDDWIVNNPAVHSFSWSNLKFIFSHDALAGIGLKSNYYRPFLFLTFAFNYVISGIKPLFYHLTSNLIHIANAILIFFLLDKFLKRRLTAFLASILFLIHPLQTEAVAYVSGRGDPMSVLFMLLALLAFLYSRRFYSYIFLVLAILSRETAFLFPVYLVVFLMSFVYKESFWLSFKKSFKAALPFFGISVFYGILRLTVLNFQNTLNFFTQANVYTENLIYRVYTFFHVLAVYFKLIFVPIGLHMERDVAVNVSFFQWPVWLGVLVVAAIILIIIRFYRLEHWEIENSIKIGDLKLEISHFRLWFFGWGFFFINLASTSGIFPINALLYEHWLYFSLFGFFTLLAFYLDKIFGFLRHHKKPLYYTAVILFVAYCSFFSVQTVRRNIIWGKTDIFYENVLRYEPENVRVLNNLANYYSDHGKIKEAEELFWRAIKADDMQPAPYYNLGNILRDRGDFAGALVLYKEALQKNNYFPFAYLNIAAIYARQGDLVNALNYLEELRKLTPNDPKLYYNIGILEKALGRLKEAKLAFEIGLALSEGNPQLEEMYTKALLDLNK